MVQQGVSGKVHSLINSGPIIMESIGGLPLLNILFVYFHGEVKFGIFWGRGCFQILCVVALNMFSNMHRANLSIFRWGGGTDSAESESYKGSVTVFSDRDNCRYER